MARIPPPLVPCRIRAVGEQGDIWRGSSVIVVVSGRITLAVCGWS